MENNFKLTIEYDGSNFHGWQRQPRDRSIQDEIESALFQMTGQKITLIGSGRTDAGVHALGQVANFKCDTHITPREFHNGLNSILADDIVIHRCVHTALDFHARFDAKGKIYHYTILNSPQPSAIGRQYHWWLRAPLDIPAMQTATRHLLGRHDFKSFEAAGSPRAHTIRKVTTAKWTTPGPHKLCLHIQADGFLRFMVRNIVGTLVEIGRGKMEPKQLKSIMAARDRNLAAATAPAQGLCLVKVLY